MRYRCPECNQIAGQNFGTTDLGDKIWTKYAWEHEDECNLPRDRKITNVTHARRRVRLTMSKHQWLEHQGCPYCSHCWNVERETIARIIDRETVVQEWEGYK